MKSNSHYSVVSIFFATAFLILLTYLNGALGEVSCMLFFLLCGFNIFLRGKNWLLFIALASSAFVITGLILRIAQEAETPVIVYLFNCITLLLIWIITGYFSYEKNSSQRPVWDIRFKLKKRYYSIGIGIFILITIIALSINYLQGNYLEDKFILRQEKKLSLLSTKKLSSLEILYSDILFLSRLNDVQEYERNRDAIEKDLSGIIAIRPAYDQIRILDTNGMEKIRVNGGKTPSVVPVSELQDKSDRSYFSSSLKLSKNEIYISPISLNKKHGKTEFPKKPVLRVSAIIPDAHGEALGILIINYISSQLEELNKIEESQVSIDQLMLFDDRGNWLSEIHKEGAKIDGGSSLSKLIPEVWSDVQKNKTGKKVINGDYYLYNKVDMNDVAEHVFADRHYKIANGKSGFIFVQKIPASEIMAIRYAYFGNVVTAYLLVCFLHFIIIRHIFKQLASEELSKIQFESVFNNAHALIGLLNAEGTIVEINPTALQFTGADRDSIIGQKLWDAPWWPKDDSIKIKLKSAIHTSLQGQFVNYEERVLDSNGIAFIVDISMRPVYDESGEILYLIAEGHDITELVESGARIHELNESLEAQVLERTKEIERAKKKLEAVNRELETFSYSVSHDLKAPLRALQGFSRTLIHKYGDQLDETGVRWLRIIEENAEQMDRLICDILSFSKISKKNVVKSEVDMISIIEEQIQHFKRTYPKESNISIGEIIPVSCDGTMMQMVWQNLIENAFKYSQKKSLVEIEIGSKRNANHTTFYIKDNGAGFDMRYYDKLFGVFQRLHGANEFEGTGVGLASVQRIIQKHGGSIRANSKVGEGTTFEFELPIN